MTFDIPGNKQLIIEHVVLDYNGTIAIDGRIISGVKERINELSEQLDFHVLTADTFGSVRQELSQVNCQVVIIGEENQDESKRAFVEQLGAQNTLSAGNGRNDALMLKEAALGIGILQNEGLNKEAMLAADIICLSIMDVFDFLKKPKRLIATLRN